MLKRLLKLFLPLKPVITIVAIVCMLCGMIGHPGELHAQIQFFTTPPEIDSFPVVKTKISVAVNGKPAPFDKSNLSLQEDGQNITNFELLDCDESTDASIAMLVDVSESMLFTLFKGTDEFYNAFPVFTSQLSPTTELALIPFNDTVTRIIPASYRSQDFFNTGNANDVAEFIDSVGGLQFRGNTDVDFAVWRAVVHLRKGTHQRKTIVLITDDAIYDYPGLTALLKQEGIALFVLELDQDTIRGNILTADATGGKLYSPRDSTQIGPMMADIAQDIFAKKCTLRYVSTHPCPWWSSKTLWIGLNYQSQKFAQTHYFNLGHNRTDSVAPVLRDIAIDVLSRVVKADETFPCERGIKTFTDSALQNFAKLKQVRRMPQFAYDSLVVVDASQAADGFYIAIDSNGNTSRIRIAYTPPVDTLDPVWGAPFRSSPRQYQFIVTELRKWDRGIKSITLDASSTNVTTDSVIYVTHKLAKVYVSRIDDAQPATVCLTATDSVGNNNNICLTFNETPSSDTTPPVITQRFSSSPYVSLNTDVTELRSGDRGIESISVTPISNVGRSTITYTSPFIAEINSVLRDSLYNAEAVVTALDSAGNSSQLTIRYVALPDVLAPEYSITVDDAFSRTVSITEKQGWDRGINTVGIISTLNLTNSQVTESQRLNVLTFSSVDPYTDATATIQAKDSAGNATTIEIEIPAQMRPAILPLTYTDPLDFGTVEAPALMQSGVAITNPNTDPIAIVRGTWKGDDSVFSLAGVLPSSFGPAGSQSIAFNFNPRLLGDWSATYTIETDKGVKYPIRMKGSSIGVIKLTLSDEQVARSGETGSLKIDISGSPDISNLDTLRFTITVDDDVAVLDAPSTDCTSADWICNYAITWTPLGGGNYGLELLRTSVLRSLKLVDAPQLTIPFRTFLSGKLQTAVSLSNISASRSMASSTDGSITIRQDCGDSIIVSRIAGREVSRIIDLIQERKDLRLTLESFVNGQVAIKLIDLQGILRYEIAQDAHIGRNVFVIPIAHLSSGSYHIILSSETSTCSRPVNILR